jgi:outer membrane protein OmpA-like peptidoglycan-associated protein/tetratricopeptide (TPR) repeat protein
MNRALKHLIILLIISIFNFPLLMGQRQNQYSTKNNRAIRAFEDAIHKYNLLDIKAAEEYFRDAVRIDPDFIEAYIVMGEMFQGENRHRDAINAYMQAVQINPDFFPNTIFYLAESYLAVGEYQFAKNSLLRFTEFQNISNPMRERAEVHMVKIEFALNALQNPVPFEPQNLDSMVNSEYDEYAPTLTADEQTLIFTRKIPRTDMNFAHLGPEYEDFFLSNRINGEWQSAINLGSPINTQNNEGAPNISADGMYLYFTACGRSGGMGSCDIYVARKDGNRWSEPRNLGAPVNTSAWESQPSISADGKTLYFTSNRKGSGMDIWVTNLDGEGKWSVPENIGPVINTSGKEMSPFIHPDNKTLFFASDSHPGMGGMDLFYSIKGDDDQWQTPVNLGYPINTFADEISLVVGASGKEAYFASEQPGGQGGSDLYFFELYEEARPTPVTYMKGFVFDSETRERLAARFELVELDEGSVIIESTSDSRTGEFLIPIPVGANLSLNAWKDGYLFFSENFAFQDVRTGVDPHLYDIPLQPIKEGESVVLKNIFFKTDSHELLPQSMSELSKLLELMTQNANLKIEIGGHTDNVGTLVYNKALSEKRALSVYNYLIENGIAEARLSYTGYASQVPVASNDTEEGRALNRRTEFKVIGNN